MTANVQIQTEGLSLRECTLDDLDLIVELFGDSETMEGYRGTFTPDAAKNWLDGVVTLWREKGYGYWILSLKETEEFAGIAGIFDLQIDGICEAEAGYVIRKKFWGQGFASEVAKACYDFALNRTDIDRVITLIDPRNSASIHLAEKYGLSFLKQSAKWGRTVHVYAISRT